MLAMKQSTRQRHVAVPTARPRSAPPNFPPAHSPFTNCPVLDLHGKRRDDAVAEVTTFLDRVRRLPSEPNTSAWPTIGAEPTMRSVTIVTGSGSHSAGGPVLRSAIRDLLEKRGMSFTLERGGGAFNIDALSGWDLYDDGTPVDSKVVTANLEEFKSMGGLHDRPGNRGNSNSGAVAFGVAFGRGIGNNIDLALEQKESERGKDFEKELRRTLKTSAKEAAREKTAEDAAEETVLRMVSEESLKDEHERITRRETGEEVVLQMASESSVRDEEERMKRLEESERELLRQVLDRSAQVVDDQKERLRQLAEIEDEQLRKALEQSCEAGNGTEEMMLEEIIALSLKEEEGEEWCECFY